MISNLCATGKIIDSNRLMLLSAVAQLGAEAVDLGKKP